MVGIALRGVTGVLSNLFLVLLIVVYTLFEATGVPFDAARPLVEAIVANTFEFGPQTSLTGPIARGDTGTVSLQINAVRETTPDLAAAFESMVDATAAVVGSFSEDGEE